MADHRTDQLIAVTAGQFAMDAAEGTIKSEAERTGSMWLPRVDPGFMKTIRRSYDQTGATTQTVDDLLAHFSAEAQAEGLSPALFWVTGFQAIAALEMLAATDGKIAKGDHPLLAHFSQCQRDAAQG